MGLEASEKLRNEEECQRYQEIQLVLNDIQKEYSAGTFDRQETELFHKSYMLEKREMEAIELGNTEMLRDALMEEYEGQVGTVFPEDELRNWKDIAITVVAISSRAAIRGGLPPEIGYSLSDSYICQIERADSVKLVATLARASQFEYCRLVSEIREPGSDKRAVGYSLHIYRCKNYILTHLHQKLTVQELAEYLKLNADYLSNLFRKYEGITISRFVLREKIRQIKRMLIYSEYTCGEIAAFFGFSSQSHLGTLFRRETGCTPAEYRKLYVADTLHKH